MIPLFHEMELAEPLKNALRDLKFEKPTPVQAKVLSPALAGDDIMACAETGSGKTAAFALPMIQSLLERPGASGLVLAPTRELAHQIADVMRDLTKYCKGFYINAIVGGADMRKQMRALKRKPRILVATPGRLNDHLKRKSIKLHQTHILVLDEGDRMLDMGFAPQLETILRYLPQQRQSMLFSATLPGSVQKLASKYLSEPHSITVGSGSKPVAKIKQSVVQVSPDKKKDRLMDELNAREGSIVVFTRTKSRTSQLSRHLKNFGFAVDHIHGDCTQGHRNRAIRNFKSGQSRILCATDIAARGIDIPTVAHVINFDLPMANEDYVHRIGRTARNGATGEAVSFVTRAERHTWNSLAKRYDIPGGVIEPTKEDKSRNRRNRLRFRPKRKRR